MKKLILLIVMVMAAVGGYAQTESFAPEYSERNLDPEYIGQVVVVNADSTTALLQKEQMTMKTSSTKFGYIPIPGASLLDKGKVYLTLKGTESKTVLPKGRVTLIVRAGKNDEDPMNVFGIFQFEVTKKVRRYALAEAGMLSGMKSTTTFNTVPFEVKKYGKDSYLVIIENAEPGQYAVVTTDVLAVSTFGVK